MFRRSLLIRVGLALTSAAIASTAISLIAAGGDTASFWERYNFEANQAEHYESLPAMRDAADAVVLGQITDIAPGRVFGAPPDDTVQYVTATVQVHRVLRGEVREVSPGHLQLELMLLQPAQLDEAVAANPRGESIFFLRHKGTEASEAGAPAEVVADNELFYRLVVMRGVIWNEAGRARVHPSSEPDFLDNLIDRPFGEIVREVMSQ